jgi:hypothetical protein
MKPVDQNKLNIPGEQKGNCQQAAVASILGLPLDQVPNFNDQPEGFWPSYYRFLRKLGLVDVQLPANYAPPCFYLAYGPSPRGVSHAVVYREGYLAHDPHPSRAGILEVKEAHLIVPGSIAGWAIVDPRGA